MLDRKPLLQDFQVATHAWEVGLRHVPETRFFSTAEDGGWSAGQIVMHLNLLEGPVNQVLHGPCEATTRPVAEKVARIHDTFGNDDVKLRAGGPILPPQELPPRDQLIARFQQQRAALRESLEQLDLSETCLGFKHALFGHLTRWEWGYFVIYHGERHLRQMERMGL